MQSPLFIVLHAHTLLEQKAARRSPNKRGGAGKSSPPSPSSFQLELRELPIDFISPPTPSFRRYPYGSQSTFSSLWLADLLQLAILAISAPATHSIRAHQEHHQQQQYPDQTVRTKISNNPSRAPEDLQVGAAYRPDLLALSVLPTYYCCDPLRGHPRPPGISPEPLLCLAHDSVACTYVHK